MKALVWQRETGLSFENEEMPVVTGKEADESTLVRVTYSGMCGTDVHLIHRKFGFDPVRILGHEFVGEDTATGQRVYVNPNGECGVCDDCRSARPHFCQHGTWTHDALGFGRNGGFAQFVVVPKQRLIPLLGNLPMDTYALAEPVACVVQGLRRLGRLDSGHNFLVLGAGIIGLLWLVTLYHKGVRRLSLVELNENRLNLIKKIGFPVNAMTPGQMKASDTRYDVIIDCTGSAAAFESAIKVLNKAGTFLIFGCAAAGVHGKVNMSDLLLNQWKILGTRMNPYTNDEAVALVEDLHKEGLLDFNKLGICVCPLSGFEKAFQDLQDGVYSKIIFEIPH